MSKLTNSEVQKLIHKTLDPMMKKEGFKRKGRTYYKKSADIIFVLHTNAVGAYFSSVTNWPSHAFSIWDGIWVDGITPGYIKRYPKKSDKDGIYIPEVHTCFHITGDDLKYGINRKEQHPYWENAIQYGVDSEPERKRRDIWVMPNNMDEQVIFLQELIEQVQSKFLNCHMKYTDIKQLYKLILEGRLSFNRNRGYEEGMAFCSDSFIGNFQGYLQYSVLFHQRYGSNEEYVYYLRRLEEWSKMNNQIIHPCYYCGYGNEFRL